MKLLPLILLAILCQTLGNVMLRSGMQQVGEATAYLATAQIDLIGQAVAVTVATVTNIRFLLGMFLLIADFFFYLTLLSRADLSYVLPVTSFSYGLTALLAYLLLNEQISMSRWFGIILICLGVLLVGRGDSSTTASEGEAAMPAAAAREVV